MTMRRNVVRAILICVIASAVIALVLGLSIAASCEIGVENMQASAGDLTEMSIEDLMSIEVVTAAKKPERMSETPAAVFVITKEDIERYGYQTLAQALRRVSGFYSDTDLCYDYLGVRGYMPTRDYNRRALLLIDGHRCNDNIYEQAPVGQDLPLDLQDIERIEVVKGPGSALWGTDAMLCVINCITKRTEDMQGLQLRQNLGWYGGQRIAYGDSLPGGLQISGSASTLNSDGQQQLYFPDFDSPENNNGIAVGIDGERVTRGYVDVSYRGFKLFYNHGVRMKNVPTAYWDSAFNVPGVDATDRRLSCELSYENPEPYAANGKLFCRVYRDSYDFLGNFPWYRPDISPPALIQDQTLSYSRSWGAEARYSRDISPTVGAILGAEYMRVSESRRRSWDLEPYYELYSDRSGSYSMFSLYTEADWSISGSLRAVAGTRLDDDSGFGGTWSPRLALIYGGSSKSTLKLLYGNALRAPSQSERTSPDLSPDLGSERITTTELVWERQLGENGRLVTSLFGFSMYDIISKVDGVCLNVGSVSCHGLETQLDYRFRSGVSGYLGLSLPRATSDNTSELLPESPRCVASAGLCVPVLAGKAFLSSEVQYISARKTLMGNWVGDFATANLTLSSSSLVKAGTLSLGVRNLFNNAYNAPGRPEHYQDYLPQGERMVQFQFSYAP